MGLMDKARRDLIAITTNDSDCGFAVPVKFIHTDNTEVTVNCLHTSHHNAIDSEGVQIDSKIASVAVAEKVLTDAGYITRNAAGVVTFENHRIDAPDSTGEIRHYIVREKFPDSNLGLIVILLTDYEN